MLLAAVLDTRAYRLPWPPGVRLYELDLPEVLAFRTRLVEGLLVYLTAKEAAQLLTGVGALSAPDSRIPSEQQKAVSALAPATHLRQPWPMID
jgi:O-methyltransferase involved in polyketide biosynthesis